MYIYTCIYIYVFLGFMIENNTTHSFLRVIHLPPVTCSYLHLMNLERGGGILESSDGRSGSRSVGEILCLKFLPQFSSYLNKTYYTLSLRNVAFFEAWQKCSRARPSMSMYSCFLWQRGSGGILITINVIQLYLNSVLYSSLFVTLSYKFKQRFICHLFTSVFRLSTLVHCLKHSQLPASEQVVRVVKSQSLLECSTIYFKTRNPHQTEHFSHNEDWFGLISDRNMWG